MEKSEVKALVLERLGQTFKHVMYTLDETFCVAKDHRLCGMIRHFLSCGENNIHISFSFPTDVIYLRFIIEIEGHMEANLCRR